MPEPPKMPEGPYAIVDGMPIRLTPARPEPVQVTLERMLAPFIKRIEALEAQRKAETADKPAKK